jgi:hypothetical protein
MIMAGLLTELMMITRMIYVDDNDLEPDCKFGAQSIKKDWIHADFCTAARLLKATIGANHLENWTLVCLDLMTRFILSHYKK